MPKTKKNTDIAIFLTDGMIKQVPARHRVRMQVLRYLAAKFEIGRTYTEREVNTIINQWHTFSDYFMLRRLLIDYHLMARTPDGAKYWLVERDDDHE